MATVSFATLRMSITVASTMVFNSLLFRLSTMKMVGGAKTIVTKKSWLRTILVMGAGNPSMMGASPYPPAIKSLKT
jgi:hypothetical protein